MNKHLVVNYLNNIPSALEKHSPWQLASKPKLTVCITISNKLGQQLCGKWLSWLGQRRKDEGPTEHEPFEELVLLR